MKLETIKTDFDELFSKAREFESLLPDDILRPNAHIHSGNFYGDEVIKSFRFQWDSGTLRFIVQIYSQQIVITYVNNWNGRHLGDTRLIEDMRIPELVGRIYPYLLLFKSTKKIPVNQNVNQKESYEKN